MSGLSKGYEPTEVEEKWFQSWMASNCFRADETSERPAFSIVIPPPNVTGILHLGHVLNNTIQDILARRARMNGQEVLWLPGTDHAGIATQTKVEQKLRTDEGKTRRDLGREAFLERVWQWKEDHGGIIINQLKRLGCSCDWSRERFTMDPEYSRWISKIFVDLFDDGLIYRGKRMVNWCPKSLTALSDEEVIMKPQKSKLYFMKYELADEPGTFLEIATTRPETLMGDTAVAVNPEDERYRALIGRKVVRPFPQAEIPIVADEHIDPEFGTGVLKVTPAHDKADFEIGLRNNLPIIDVFNPDGTLNEHAGEEFAGIDRFEARKKAAAKLHDMGLLIKVEEHENNVGFSERADVPVEPRISMQWFLKYPCVDEATEAVASKSIKFRPERWSKTYLHWLENIQDWCISRQLWWGHRIPVWYRKDQAEELRNAESLDSKSAGKSLHVGIEPPSDAENWVQDDDVLDTWFSSWLWPFATMSDSADEPSATEKKFYPTTDLVTAPEIIFFWVARMIMAGYRWRGELPFKNVFFTGIVRDGQGRKMSKSLGNSPDPLDIIAKYGADALRFAIMKVAPLGGDIRFAITNEGDEEIYPQVEEGRHFANKLWNAARYRLMQSDAGDAEQALPLSELSIVAVDILAKLDQLQKNLEISYADYKFNDVAQLLYEFFWSNYCDLYLEAIKHDFRPDTDPRAKEITLQVMDTVFHRLLIFLHPYMPHITEELWQTLGFGKEGTFLMHVQIPSQPALEGMSTEDVADARAKVIALYDAASRARNLKAEYNLGSSKKVSFVIVPTTPWIAEVTDTFAILTGAASVTIDPDYEGPTGTPATVTDPGVIHMPLEGLIDVEAETKRLEKELSKVRQEIDKATRMLSNEKFIANAKPDVIAEHKRRLTEFRARKEQLTSMLENLH
ncbi:MAG: valyl-tRNA synthetase [Verrucomicrobiales bacterium]|jgi:valyl-tRNA synthetase